MATNSEAEETTLFTSAYQAYREAYCKAGGPKDLAPYRHVEPDDEKHEGLGIYCWMFQEFLRELANETNRLAIRIEQLRAWSSVYERYDSDDKIGLMLEFIEPLAVVAFSQPATLRFRFIYAVSHTSHQANLIANADWQESKLPKDDAITFKVMTKVSSNWKSFSQFSESFSGLNHDEWKAHTKDFRNKYNHQIPPRFELGHTQLVKRVPSKSGTSYAIGASEPLKISDHLDALAFQHEAALMCFDDYSQLVAEQLEALAR